MYACWVLIFIFAIIVIARVIFRILTRHYEETVGEIVDFNTQKIVRDSYSYIHKPIVEFFTNGKTYRCVKATFYHSVTSEWNKSLVKDSLHNYVRVRYNSKDPRKSYCLYSIKDLKYNLIILIPFLLVLLFIVIYEFLH